MAAGHRRAIIGEFAGDSLDFHPSLTLSFTEALETVPMGRPAVFGPAAERLWKEI